MSKPFIQLKSPLLGLEDKLTFGKFKDCRICDLVQDEYEYLIFLEKGGYVKYNLYLTEKIKQIAGFALEEQNYREEILPYLEDVPY